MSLFIFFCVYIFASVIPGRNRKQWALTQTLGRTPTIQELSTILNKTPKRINQLKFYLLQEPSSLDALNLDKLEEEQDAE